ncbi:hypothetical protein [Nocardioides marmoraquaticus]
MDVVTWLLESDPAVAWRARRDLLDEPASSWAPVRARVEHEGVGAALLAARDDQGTWEHAAFWPEGYTEELFRAQGQAWTATSFVLHELVELGLDPASPTAAALVEAASALRWEHDQQPFWDGEVEECINGRLVVTGCWFGVDVTPVVERLVGDQLPDGAWNCERERGALTSSFDSTVNVVEALLAADAAPDARAAGEEWLLVRRLAWRQRDGEVADPDYLLPAHPTRWHHDVLRGLEHFRRADRRDERLADAVDVVRSLRLPDGRWPLPRVLRGPAHASYGVVGEPSPWVTLAALRVLRWWDAG